MSGAATVNERARARRAATHHLAFVSDAGKGGVGRAQRGIDGGEDGGLGKERQRLGVGLLLRESAEHAGRVLCHLHENTFSFSL